MFQRISTSLTVLAGAASIVVGMAWTAPAGAVTPFVGTIRYFAFNFAPVSWAHCDGQLIATNQNDALFALIGTTYGGDGRTTFGLPDMRGRVPVHQGTGPGLSPRQMGQRAGAPTVTLNANQISHTHTLRANSNAGDQADPTGHTLAVDGADTVYLNAAPDVQMHANSITNTGGSQAHNNQPPSLGVYCNIAMFGIFPSRN